MKKKTYPKHVMKQFTPLMRAVIKNNREEVESLVMVHGRQLTDVGLSALMVAIGERNVELANFLVPYECDVYE